ncbi:hypothetical protein B0H15DRAFT_847481, partial [Mycena belliarum]
MSGRGESRRARRGCECARVGTAAWQCVWWPGGGASAGRVRTRIRARDEDRAAHSLHAWVAQPRRRAAGTTARGSGGGSALLVADVRAGLRGGSWRLQWGDVGVPRRVRLYAGRVRARDWRGCRVHRARDESRCSRRRTIRAGARAAAVDGRCADARRRCIRGSAGVTWQRPPAFARPRLSRLGASAAVLRDRAPLQWRGEDCAAAVGDLRTRCASAGGGRRSIRVTWAYVRRAVRGVDSGAAARWGAVGRDSRASGRAGVRPSGAFSEVSLRHLGRRMWDAAVRAPGGRRLGARRTPGAAGARAVWTERERRAPSSRRRVSRSSGARKRGEDRISASADLGTGDPLVGERWRV